MSAPDRSTQSERRIARGPLGNQDRTIIPAGAVVYSTHPQWPRDGKASRRRIDLSRLNCVRWEVDRIVWAGSGGYWRWVNRLELGDLVDAR